MLEKASAHLSVLIEELRRLADADRARVSEAGAHLLRAANQTGVSGHDDAPSGQSTPRDGSKGAVSGAVGSRRDLHSPALARSPSIKSRKPADWRRETREAAAPTAETVETLRFLLLRHAGHESHVWFEFMVGCLPNPPSSPPHPPLASPEPSLWPPPPTHPLASSPDPPHSSSPHPPHSSPPDLTLP